MPSQPTRRRFLKTTGVAALGAANAQAVNRSLIVDVHAHLKHGDAAKTEYSAKDIIGVMDAVGIDRSIVFIGLGTALFIQAPASGQPWARSRAMVSMRPGVLRLVYSLYHGVSGPFEGLSQKRLEPLTHRVHASTSAVDE